MWLLIENKSLKDIQVWLEDVFINETAYEGMLNEYIRARAVGIYTVKLNYESLGISKLEDIQKVEFRFAVCNFEYSESVFLSDILTVQVN